MEGVIEVLLAVLVGFLGLCILFHLIFVRGKTCRSKTSLRGKTVLLTGKPRGTGVQSLPGGSPWRAGARGAQVDPKHFGGPKSKGGNTGIGKATALDLARRGARVVLACRSRERGEAAVQDIRRESGNKEVVFMSLDLASLSSVRAFAEAFLRSEPRLDILINNAALIKDGASEDGFNVVFQVNHLAHFLLTHLLLDRLKQCAPSRVVVVASDVHRNGRIDFQSVHLPVEGYMEAFKSYFNSKLGNLFHVQELASRLEGTNVTSYAVHPGAVHTEALRHSPFYLRPFLWGLSWLLFRNPENGAQTSIYCATQEGIEKLSGCYFEDCRQKDPNPNARDPTLAKKLWEFSEKLLGLAS